MDALSRLPEADQERMAAIILEELEDDSAWDEKFANSQGLLKRLSEEAEDEYLAGRTEPLTTDDFEK